MVETPYDPSNVFARILRGELPAKKQFEDETLLALHDLHPAAPVHLLILPKGEYVSFDDFCEKAGSAAVGAFFQRIGRIAVEMGLQQSGYRLITNHGADAAQSVPHFHVHLLGGRALGGLVPGDPETR